LKVWQTNLPHVITERVRRFSMEAHDRRDWQLALSDSERLPESVAQELPANGNKSALQLLRLREYPEGYQRFSLVEVSPASSSAISNVERVSYAGLVGFRAHVNAKTYLAVFNPGSETVNLPMDIGGEQHGALLVSPRATALDVR
jgi:hypothetical protein